MKDYSDIINLPNHKSKNHPQMSLSDRAAQFAPFAALSGYEESIAEEGRIVLQKPVLNEEQITNINEALNYLLDKKDIEVEIAYFIKDNSKKGGLVNKEFQVVHRIDEINKKLFLKNKTSIEFSDLIDIKIANYNNWHN